MTFAMYTERELCTVHRSFRHPKVSATVNLTVEVEVEPSPKNIRQTHPNEHDAGN